MKATVSDGCFEINLRGMISYKIDLDKRVSFNHMRFQLCNKIIVVPQESEKFEAFNKRSLQQFCCLYQTESFSGGKQLSNFEIDILLNKS